MWKLNSLFARANILMLTFLSFSLMSFIDVTKANAQSEAWCNANPANCVCSDTLQSTTYSRVADYGHGGSFLGDQVGSKPCHYEGVNTSVQAVYGSNTFSGALAISSDPQILSLLPHRDPIKASRFLRPAGDNFGGTGGQNSTYRMGYDPVPLGTTTKRMALRWYVYYSPNYDATYDTNQSCTNGKIAHISATGFSAPYVTISHYQTARTYSFIETPAANYGWSWAGHNDYDGFQGDMPHNASQSRVDLRAKRGHWLRFEVVARRPRTVDSAASGFDWEFWVTDITAGTPPVQDMRFSAGCTNCIKLNGGVTSNFTWDPSIHNLKEMAALHTELYRAGTCNGYQAWMYVAVAKWDTDAGQMIGAAAEVEGGTYVPPPNLPPVPAAPTGLVGQSVSSSQINLSWNDNANNEDQFKIERSDSANGSFTQVGTTNANILNFINSGLNAGTTYFYRVKASNAGGDSSSSNVVSVTTPGVAPLPNPSASISQLILANNDTMGGAIMTLVNGSFYDLNTVATQNLNIEALTASSNGISRVDFKLEPTSYVANPLLKSEGSARYAMCGDWDPCPVQVPLTKAFLNIVGSYKLTVTPYDSAGTIGIATVISFSVRDSSVPPPPADTTAPVLSAIQAADITQTSANIKFNTNENGDSYVQYGLTANYGSVMANSSMVQAHSVALTNLAAGTTYHFRVQSKDASGNLSPFSVDGTFMTVTMGPPPAGDTLAPSAPGSLVANGTRRNINLSWSASTDNVGVAGYYVYRSTNSSTGFVKILTTTTTSVVDNKITRRATYYYYVRAYDAAGNISGNSNTTLGRTR